MRPLFFFLVIGTLTFLGACKEQCKEGDDFPRGAVRSLDSFSAIAADLSAVIDLVPDTSAASPFIELVVEENLQTHLSTRVRRDTLYVSLNYCFSNHADILLRVHYRDLNSIIVNGPTDFKSGSIFTQDELNLEVNSSGNIAVTTNVNVLNSHINGSGNILINGEMNTHNMLVNNSGSIDAYQAVSQIANVESNGSGTIFTRTFVEINGSLNNSGDVYYKGFPVINAISNSSGMLVNDN